MDGWKDRWVDGRVDDRWIAGWMDDWRARGKDERVD